MQSGTNFANRFFPAFTRHLSPDDSDPSGTYLRKRISLSIFSLAFTIIYLALLAFTGLKSSFVHLAALSTNLYLSFLIFAFSIELFFSIVKFPFDYYADFLLEHKFHLSNQTFSQWITRKLKGALVGSILGVVVLVVFYFLLTTFPETWWMLFAAFFFLFQVVVAQLFPSLILPLFYKLKPLQDEQLTTKLESLVHRFGYAMSGVYSFDLSRETRKANAALTGLGRSRKIIISDTLLEDFSHEEIEVVLAHELGHLVKHHMIKGIAVSGITSVFGFFVMAQIYSIYTTSNMLAPIALPAILFLALILAVFGVFALPAGNYFSRKLEREADQFALESTGMVSQFTSSMRKLGRLNLTPENPPVWIEKIFFSHPSIGARIRTAENMK